MWEITVYFSQRQALSRCAPKIVTLRPKIPLICHFCYHFSFERSVMLVLTSFLICYFWHCFSSKHDFVFVSSWKYAVCMSSPFKHAVCMQFLLESSAFLHLCVSNSFSNPLFFPIPSRIFDHIQFVPLDYVALHEMGNRARNLKKRRNIQDFLPKYFPSTRRSLKRLLIEASSK
jgi:hypothetical protein